MSSKSSSDIDISMSTTISVGSYPPDVSSFCDSNVVESENIIENIIENL